MTRSLISAFLAVAIWVSSCAATAVPPTKSDIIAQTQLSTVRIIRPMPDEGENAAFVCTAFIVDPSHLLTVRHCIGDDLTQEGIPLEVEKTSDSLALLKVQALMGPPLRIRKEPLVAGEEVIGIGYGLGFMNVFTRFVSVPKYLGEDVLLDGLLLRGMSGGPVVDRAGKVVGIVQSGHEGTLTVLCGQDEITKFLK